MKLSKNDLTTIAFILFLGAVSVFQDKIPNFLVVWSAIIIICILLKLFVLKDKKDQNIKEINLHLEKMTNGDFSFETSQMSVSSETDKILFNIGEVAKTVRELVSKLESEVKDLYSSGEALGTIARSSANIATEVAKTVEGLAVNASNQVNDIAICNDNVNDTTNTSHNIDKQIQEISKIANNFVNIAVQSKQDVEQTLTKINNIETTSHKISEQITELGKTSKEIGQIVDLITAIAKQTNLLALNAAIEAARAGDQGKGFAVVADEVKKLATQTTSAADKIKGMIYTIQQESDEAVSSTQLSLENVKQGASSFAAIKTNFDNIYQQANVISGETKTISKTIDYLVNKNDEVLQAMCSISSSTESNAASAEEISASTEEHSAGTHELSTYSNNILIMARNLTVSSSIFKLDNKPVIFYWNKNFFTGISEVDYQHFKIVNYINDLYREFVGNKNKEKLYSILTDLAEFTRIHFADEQILMKKHNYPRLDIHMKEHTDLLKQLGRYIEDIKNNRAKIDDKFLAFLNEWLSHHILEEDMQYAPYLKDRGEK